MSTENPSPSVRCHEPPELAVSRRSRPRVLALAERVFRRAAETGTDWGRIAAASGLTTYHQSAVDPGPAVPGLDQPVRLIAPLGERPAEQAGVEGLGPLGLGRVDFEVDRSWHWLLLASGGLFLVPEGGVAYDDP